MTRGSDETVLFLAGDVMTGRGIDQVLPHSVDPTLREPAIMDARDYVGLAEAASGPIEAPLSPRALWGFGLDVLEACAPDARLVNLETSATTAGAFSREKSVHYRMHPANGDTLSAAGLSACALANNHVLDFGADGLVDTLKTLREVGVKPCGAGRDLAEARRPAAIPARSGARVRVAAVGSGSSGIPASWAAARSRPGVDRLPDLAEDTAREVADRLAEGRGPGDIAVVSIHWGGNWGYEVTPDMRGFARALVDAGVDVVHGHSSHHIRPIEVYRERLILYGAGDLITDYEGIGGFEDYRGDLGAMIFPALAADGALRRLWIQPTRMRRLRLSAPSREDEGDFLALLNRISAPHGAQFSAGEGGGVALARADEV